MGLHAATSARAAATTGLLTGTLTGPTAPPTRHVEPPSTRRPTCQPAGIYSSTMTSDAAPVLRLWVAGIPAPKGSKRYVGNGRMIESSKLLPDWRNQLSSSIEWTWAGAGGATITGPVGVRLDFVMPRPKRLAKRADPPAVSRPDVDKLARAVLDELQLGGVLRDDSQVTSLHASKRVAGVGESAGVAMEVWVL